MTRRLITALVCLACVVFSLSCKTGATAQKQQSADQQAPEVVAVEEGFKLAFADEPGVVLKFRLDQVDRVAPALQILAEQSSGPDERLLGALIAKDWTQLFGLVTRSEAPESLGVDESAPVYVSLATVGGARFEDAFSYGAVLQPDDALPVALRTRVVARAGDPDALEAAFEQTRQPQSRDDYSLSIRRKGGYVYADYIRVRPDLDADVERAHESTPPRRTPAYEEFAASKDPMAIYFRTRQAMAYGAAANQYDMTEALETASPAIRYRVLGRIIAMNLNSSMLSPPSQRESEDTCVRVTGDGEKMAMLTGLSTQTTLGQTLAAANDRAAIVPRSVGDDVGTFAEVRANFAVDKMREAAPIEWADSRGAPTSSRPIMSSLRRGGWSGYTALLGSPTFPARLMSTLLHQKSADAAGAPLPHALLLELVMPATSDDAEATRGQRGFPFLGVAMAFAASELGEQYTAEVRDMLEEFPSPSGVQTASEARGDETLLRATNADALAEGTEDVELSAGRRARSDSPRCVGNALSKRQALFFATESMNKGAMGPEEWLQMLDNSGVDQALEACAEASPEHAEALTIARARIGELLVRYAQLLEKPEVVEALRKRGCDLGDDVQCEMLED